MEVLVLGYEISGFEFFLAGQQRMVEAVDGF
jgi:hypothetical protein